MKKLQNLFLAALAVVMLSAMWSCEEDPIETPEKPNTEKPDTPGGDNNGDNGGNNGGDNGGSNANLPVNSIVVGDATNIEFNKCKIPITVNAEKSKRFQVVLYFWEDVDGIIPDFENPGDIVVFGTYLDPAYGTGKNQTFSADLTYLKEKTTYRCVGIIQYDEGQKVQSESKTFTTAELVLDCSKAVDMGLSVKWASYNLGASKPEEAGDFYAWGETAPKQSYTEYTYLLSGKYTSADGLTTLAPADDAATVNWGEGFRMPTCDEKHELLRNTDRYYLSYHGVDGVLFVSQVNGNKIFFPYTGGMYGTNVQRADDLIGIWTSTAHENDDSAYIMCNIIANSGLLEKAGFDMDATAASFNLSSYRYRGYSVRAVSK